LIPFTKAHACGNDFLIIDEADAAGYDKAELAQRLCDRNTGIGADGVEFYTSTGDFSAKITLYNADGSLAEISGNGTRCVAAWMAEELNLQAGDEIALETDAGVRVCTIQEFRDSDDIGPTVLLTTDMDVPEFEQRTVELADGMAITGVFVDMGNPHFVIVLDGAVPDPDDFSIGQRAWEDVGEEICFHAEFPEQTNVEFVRLLAPASDGTNQVGLRVFERGVGPTSSSGTGTCAAATAMIGIYGAQSPLEVAAPGGIQTVEWAGAGERLYLTGPATLIANGEAW
jgi:diaminopimelate epimerase